MAVDVGHFNGFRDQMHARYPGLPRDVLEGFVRRHGSRASAAIGEATTIEDLGTHFGAGLTQREVDYFRREEWALTAEDVLWRRTKAGLHMDAAQREAVARYLGA